jgi:hypothetical protein
LGEAWNEAERVEILKAFLASDWIALGLPANDPGALTDFYFEFKRQIPLWATDEVVFSKFLRVVSWDIKKYTEDLIGQFEKIAPEKRILLMRIAQDRLNELESAYCANAYIYALRGFIESEEKAFSKDCALLGKHVQRN